MTNVYGKTPLAIIGAGGHGRVVAMLAQRAGYPVKGFLDNRIRPVVDGFPILGEDEYLDSVSAGDFYIAMGLGSRLTLVRRSQLCGYVDMQGLDAPRLIDPDATLLPSVDIGRGTQVLMGARIQHGASIGEWCIVNTASVIEHDCRIDARVHIAPGAVLCGGVTVGEGALIGAGARIREGVTVGCHAVVGLGAVVVDDVGAGQTVTGVPARGSNVE